MYNAGVDNFKLAKLFTEYNVIPSSLSINNNYLDKLPTFTWETYSGSKKLQYNCFDLVFMDDYYNVLFKKENLFSTGSKASYTLGELEWYNIFNNCNEKFFVYIIYRENTSFVSGNYYSEIFEFNKPNDFESKCLVKPYEWGFESQYFFESNKAGHTTTTLSKKGLTITTNRLRCGFIENSYVVLSPRRKNAGNSYLELYFNKPIYAFMYGISLWSYNEELISGLCSAVVEVLNSERNWILNRNLLNDSSNPLTTKSTNYQSTYSDGIYGLRFVATAPALGDRNKGRICLNDIILSDNRNNTTFFFTNYITTITI